MVSSKPTVAVVMYLLPLIVRVASQDQYTECALVDELEQRGEVSHKLHN